MGGTAARLLLEWYDRGHRQMPWRGLTDPYAIWVSETMLQQTRVETVIGYFSRFMARFPTVADLAAADEAEVLKLWEGLGYYSRARNLHKGAQQVMERFGGVMPDTVEKLLTISGIGPYTAGAVASIAFSRAVPAVDGNVIRVVSRVNGLRESMGQTSAKKQLEALAAAMVDPNRPGDYNQAVMDLGATVCTPGTPDCAVCPLQSVCDAYAKGDAEELPKLEKKKPPKELNYDVLILRQNGRAVLSQRKEKLLEGLYVFPMLEGHDEPEAIRQRAAQQTGLLLTTPVRIGEGHHVFTHRIWRMNIYLADAEGECKAPYAFYSLEDMEKITIPTAMRAAVTLARAVLKE